MPKMPSDPTTRESDVQSMVETAHASLPALLREQRKRIEKDEAARPRRAPLFDDREPEWRKMIP